LEELIFFQGRREEPSPIHTTGMKTLKKVRKFAGVPFRSKEVESKTWGKKGRNLAVLKHPSSETAKRSGSGNVVHTIQRPGETVSYGGGNITFGKPTNKRDKRGVKKKRSGQVD